MGVEVLKVYDRDFFKLTEEELSEWKKLEEEEVVASIGNMEIRKSKFHEFPKAARHYQSLFPNNYLDIVDLQNVDELNCLTDNFLQVLEDKQSNERTILNFINENRAYSIIASLFSQYDFGHHEAFIFPEFQLGNSVQVDYLLVGKSSGGYEFIFVELEHPNGSTFLKDGNLGLAFRNGLKQVNDWRRWLEVHFSSLHETFKKYKNPKLQFPEEFLITDRTRLHYAVIAGRRSDFEENKDLTYKLRREESENKIALLHYDNLYDMARNKIGDNTY